MNRDEKTIMVSELRERFSRASVALVTSNKGLTVAQSTLLRKTLREAGGEYKVAKHTLTKRAVEGTPYAGLAEFLTGARNLVFGYADPIALTKVLLTFANQTDKLDIDGGAVEGHLVRAAQVEGLANMPGLDSLRARVVRQATSPGTRVLAMAANPGTRLAGAIESLVNRLSGDGSAV